MKNKQIRRIIILIMCLVLVFNLAVSASASSAVAYTSISAGVAVASALQSLGVISSQDTTAYATVIDDAVSHLETIGGFITAGAITMAGIFDQSTVMYKSYARADMLQTLLEWLYNDGIVSTAPQVNNHTFQEYIAKAMTFPYYVLGNQTYNGVISPCVAWSESKIWVQNKYETSTLLTSSDWLYHYAEGDEFSGRSTSWYFTDYKIYKSSDKPAFTNRDIALGNIESPFIDGVPVYFGSLAVYYPWASQAISVPLPGTSTDEDWVPVTIGGISVDTDVIAGSQADAQAGTVADGVTWVESETVPDVTPGTATLSDILSAVLSIPQAIVGSIAQALSNFFGISGTADAYAISLTDFFPFCIPFDIYEFLSVLSAAPEAPVFHWEIPVPQLGRTFDIDVDLSPWDPVAAVFRTFELLAFIVGLGMITREKFLRS